MFQDEIRGSNAIDLSCTVECTYSSQHDCCGGGSIYPKVYLHVVNAGLAWRRPGLRPSLLQARAADPKLWISLAVAFALMTFVLVPRRNFRPLRV